MLAEEGRARHERARSLRVELVRRIGEDDEVAGARRMRHVDGRARAVRDVTGLGLRVRPVDHLPALRRAVSGPVVRVGEPEEGRLDRGDGRSLVARGDLLEPATGRVAAREVEVDLDGAAGPAGLGLADGLTGGRTAVRGLRLREQSHVHEHLARVDREELRREAVIRGHEVRRPVRHERIDEGQRVVSALVRPFQERLALLYALVRRSVHLHVVVGGVRGSVRQRLGHKPEELMLELVGRGIADHREVRLVLVEDVLDHRLMACSPVQALLDVRLLADDPGLHDCEVGSGGGGELLREVFREVAGKTGLRPSRPARDCT